MDPEGSMHMSALAQVSRVAFLSSLFCYAGVGVGVVPSMAAVHVG